MLKLVWIPNIAQLEPAKEHFVFLSFIITLLGVFISAIDYLHDHNVLGRYIFGRASFRSNRGEGLEDFLSGYFNKFIFTVNCKSGWLANL